MTNPNWLLYGATGYTGKLIVEEALRRGHRPLLSGRSAEKLQALAAPNGLEWQAVSLDDTPALDSLLENKSLVVHAAGPYMYTARPMQEACLRKGVHYIDITGEIPVFEQTFALDQQARERGIVLISGAGLDVVPTDCLAVYAARQLPEADQLEIALTTLGGVSAGTLKSGLGMISQGGLVRREGRLQPLPLGLGAKTVRFSHAPRNALPVPWGDLVTAYHSTGISNITTYMAYPPRLSRWISLTQRPMQTLLSIKAFNRLAAKLIERTVEGPDEETRRTARSYFYACASASGNRQVEAWLETGEAYSLTAQTAVRLVEKIFERPQSGALSPAQVAGPDFILELENTRRFDSLP